MLEADCYARALLDLCAEEGCCERVLDELTTLSAAFEAEPRFMRLLSSSEITKAEKRRLLDGCLQGRAHEYVQSCLKLMCDKRQIRLLPKLKERFSLLYYEKAGILPVRVTSASPLSPAQREKLKRRLEELCQKQVLLSFTVDKACLGGLMVEYENKLIDDTVRGRLKGLARYIQNAKL